MIKYYEIWSLHLQNSLDWSGCEKKFPNTRIANVFGKLQIKIINFIENCESNFLMIKYFFPSELLYLLYFLDLKWEAKVMAQITTKVNSLTAIRARINRRFDNLFTLVLNNTILFYFHIKVTYIFGLVP